MSNIIQPLTPTEQTKPTYTAWDYETARQHTQEMSTMGIGPSLEEQDRLRWKGYREFLGLAAIGVMATFGGLIVLWALSMVLRGIVG